MSLRLRRVIYFIFIIIFLIVAPVILLYSTGYRYDFEHNRLKKTGLIFLTSKQKNISVYINNVFGGLLSKELYLRDLLPGDYELTAELENYYPWTKKLKVESGETTFARNILLWKKNLPAEVMKGKISILSYSKDKKTAAMLLRNDSWEELYFLNLGNETSKLLYRSQEDKRIQFLNISIGESNKKIILEKNEMGEKKYLIFNLDKPDTILTLDAFTSLPMTNVRWDKKNDNVIYAKNINTLYRIDIAGNQSRPIMRINDSTLGDYLINGDNIFYLKDTGDKTTIIKQKMYNEKEIFKTDLPYSSDYFFGENIDRFLTIIDAKKNKLLLVDLESSIFTGDHWSFVELEGKNASFMPNGDKMLYYNDFEIWLYDPAINEKILINRYSQNINEAVWYPNFEHATFILDQKQIKTIELYWQEKNVTDLVKYDLVKNLAYNEDGTIIYFTGEIGKQKGFYKLEVQ